MALNASGLQFCFHIARLVTELKFKEKVPWFDDKYLFQGNVCLFKSKLSAEALIKLIVSQNTLVIMQKSLELPYKKKNFSWRAFSHEKNL